MIPAPRIKICGIGAAEDALAALEAGADALGFVFHPASPRAITAADWPQIRGQLPPFSHCLAVFAGGDEPMIPSVLGLGGFAGFQLHGAELSPEHLASLGSLPGTFYRAFDPDRDNPEEAAAFLDGARPQGHQGQLRGILLDPRRGSLAGGTGSRASEAAVRSWLARFPDAVLAGGLSPENVAEVVRTLGPRAVDASSGLERSPGRKDPEKLRAFVRNARGAHGTR